VRAGGPGLDLARALALDGEGNLLVAGTYGGTARFGETTLSATHARGTVVAKLDPTGRFLWARTLGGCDRQDKPQAIAVDAAGHVVVATSFAGSVTLDGVTRAAEGPADLLVAKLDRDGRLVWLATAPRGDPATDHGLGLAVGPDGAITVAGAFELDARFGATTLASTGDAEIFVARLDAGGAWRWASQAGGVLADGATAVAVDVTGQSVITGAFTGEASFGVHSVLTPLKLPPPTTDCFVARVDAGGTFTKAKRLGFASAVRCQAIALGVDGTATLAGSSCWSNCRSFVARVDAEGTLLWHLLDQDVVGLNPVGEQAKLGYGVAVDASGTSVVTGRIAGSAKFGASVLAARGVSDGFVARVEPAGGAFLWARTFGDVGADVGHAVALDAAGGILVAGQVNTSSDLLALAGDLAVWKVAP
jgi:hypothetical protein